MIGIVKIIRTERINQKLRIHFVAGEQALEYFRQYQEIATTLAADLSAHPRDVVDLVRKQADQLQAAEKDLRQLRLAYSAFEAQDLLANAEMIGARKLIAKVFEHRPVSEIRSLGMEFKEQAEVVALLATFDGQKLVLVVTCGAQTGLSARELLNRQLSLIGGRGGGDDQIAQGGGAANLEQVAAFFADTKTFL
jgi:alanyl-tRNA synthetase